jgi:hypothetical protein
MRFREITEAYEVLGDPVRRQAYDSSGPSRHIPVLSRHATGAVPESFGEMATAGPQVSGAPTVLGASKPRLIGAALLCAGPVRIAPSPGTEDGTPSFAVLHFAILDSWWKR